MRLWLALGAVPVPVRREVAHAPQVLVLPEAARVQEARDHAHFAVLVRDAVDVRPQLVDVAVCVSHLVDEIIFLFVFNAPRPKRRSGLSADRLREQQRWAWCVTGRAPVYLSVVPPHPRGPHASCVCV